MFNFLSSLKRIVISGCIAFFSFNASAELTSYNSNGVDLVYSSVSDVTWTKDANLLRTLFASQSFTTVVDNILAVSPSFRITPTIYSPSTIYTVSSRDFSMNGTTSWYGAMAYIHYLNSINYGGSNNWYLPVVENQTFGYNISTNSTTKGDELAELFYSELGGKAFQHIPNTATFDNEQYWHYWNGNNSSGLNTAWEFDFSDGFQVYAMKVTRFYAWAVSPGRIAAVPEPSNLSNLIAGLCLLVFIAPHLRRKTNLQGF